MEIELSGLIEQKDNLGNLCGCQLVQEREIGLGSETGSQFCGGQKVVFIGVTVQERLDEQLVEFCIFVISYASILIIIKKTDNRLDLSIGHSPVQKQLVHLRD